MPSTGTNRSQSATSKSAERKSKAKAARLVAERAQHRRRVLGRVGWVTLIGPGPGGQAIDFTLPSTKGGQVSLAGLRGKTVLTYWHEGLGCQPCWDQIRDIEKEIAKFTAAGIDEFYSITSGPAQLIAQKMSDERLQSVALADSDLAVSKRYAMNQYGVMGDSRDGHSFLLVGPDGEIVWRADYGGAPNYTMYVPVDQVLADMKAGRKG